MKKILVVILSVIIVYSGAISVFNRIFCKAYFYEESFTIKYDEKKYCLYSDLYDFTVLDGEPSNITGILNGDVFDYIFFPREYIYHLDCTEDVNTDFIVYESITTLVFVEENFVFPNVNDNTVEAAWFSWDKSDIVRDEKIISDLVECAKAGIEKPLNKQIYELITKNNGKSCFLKFEGYPITANYTIETTEYGTYYLRASDKKDEYTVFLVQDFLDDMRQSGDI
ncbi:MAG: hypothetical protein E7557_04815 [Ruminococcaceae bacterium]|nr:hypothetical protein [Oscillospiraceae bacterium]